MVWEGPFGNRPALHSPGSREWGVGSGIGLDDDAATDDALPRMTLKL